MAAPVARISRGVRPLPAYTFWRGEGCDEGREGMVFGGAKFR